LVRGIAKNKGHALSNHEETKKAWGSSLQYLSVNGLLTKSQEQAISSVYTLVSKGSHVPIGFTDEEYARFSRNLVASICYFILKVFSESNA